MDGGFDTIIVISFIWLREFFFYGGPSFGICCVDACTSRGLTIPHDVSLHFAIKAFPFKGALHIGHVGSGRLESAIVSLAIHASAGRHVHWDRRVIELAGSI